jgi:uncharacterized protein YaaN involved in tellurite resistance
MNPALQWAVGTVIAILGVSVPVLVMLLFRKSDRQQAELAKRDAVIEKQNELIDRQRETIIDNKIALGQLTHTAESVNRLVGAFPIPQQQDRT